MANPAQPLQYDSASISLGARHQTSKTVAASPTGSAETIICSLTVSGNLATSGIILLGWAALTIGTNGVSANLKIRQTDASGSTIAATGATTATAADLRSISALGLDASPSLPGQVYVLTMTVASGSAASTVSACQLTAIVL